MATACLFVAMKAGEQPKKMVALLPAVNLHLPRQGKGPPAELGCLTRSSESATRYWRRGLALDRILRAVLPYD